MCGVVGILGKEAVNQKIFDALTMLQHRGQDAAGILTCDGYHMSLRKDKGLVVEAIRTRHMERLQGNLGIGHVRYPTAGSDSEFEAQPFYVNSPYGIALAHNGNLINTDEIRKNLLEHDFRHINTSSDSELLLNVLAAELHKAEVSLTNFSTEIFFNAMRRVYQRCIGGYAVVGVIAGAGLFAFRDPHGIRPLVLGKKEINGVIEYMVASETVALDCDGYEVMGDLKAGEAIFINLDGQLERKVCAMNARLSPCIFEYVYLARPDSVIDGASVYSARLEMGRIAGTNILRELSKHDIDVVIPVPDSGRHAALPLSCVLDVPYREGFVKNRYVGRTFIMPNQIARQKSIRKKLNTIDHEFKGKHVLLVDDSIVRGNTSKLIVEMARKAGARKVSIVSTAPVVRYPNVYGIDMPTHEELVGHNRSIDQIAKWIGVDHLFYLSIDDLIQAVNKNAPQLTHFDTSVFDGNYVTGGINEAYFACLLNKRKNQDTSTVRRLGSVDIHNQE
ncbi:amidophosphoribosyltransferase [Fastidiosibacter lacustris]|uniref:amidophosphoribosyltransferase n=1 Tax=Fastidiosibacter lacustris TaxID=2056695 RepID=UPI000E347466|nr:amidophosphoribosyltransferase [Fastidiosibacter lacustris]